MSEIKGWQNHRLDKIGELYSGATPSTANSSFWGGDIVWITPSDLSELNTAYLHDSKKKITEKGYNACSAHLLPPNSITISSRAPIGYVALPQVEFCTNQGCKSILLSDAFDPEFTYHNVRFHINKLKNLGEGTTFAEISKAALATIELPFPHNRKEQTQIAAILSTIDKAIEQTEAIIAKQQRIKTGLMQDLLTRGIDKAGNIRSEATHEFKDSLLGRIPMAWEVKTLASVSEFITSGSRGWAQYYSVEGATFIRIGNLTREHINLRLDDIIHVQPPESSEGKRTSVLLGDILISITADLGIIGVVPANLGEAYVNQHVALLRPKETGELSRFWGWYLSSRRGQVQIEKLNESGAKAGLSLPSVGNLLVPDFSEREKVQITKQLDRTTNSIIDQNTRLAKLRRLKTGLMQDLLTGKVRVTDLFTPSNN